MKLLNLTLDHFKGIGHFELSLPDGCSANIYGENSAGKTTLADAYFWLLFGVDSEGRSPGRSEDSGSKPRVPPAWTTAYPAPSHTRAGLLPSVGYTEKTSPSKTESQYPLRPATQPITT